MESDEVSATETNTVNSDRNIDVTTREDLFKIVTPKMEEIETDSDNWSIRQLDRSHQEHFCKKTSKNDALESNRYEKMPVVRISRFIHDGRIVIIFSDACQAVLKLWRPYRNLQSMLKRYGIDTQRFNQSELKMLKSIGAVDIQVKQCSFIAEEDFLQLLAKYDENCNTDYAKYIQFSQPVDINSYHSATNVQSDQSGRTQVLFGGINSPSQSTTSLPYKVLSISIEKQDFISLSELSSLLETHFERPELLTQVLLNLKVDVGRLTASELQRIEIHTGIDGSLGRLYITRKDFERVLRYTSALLDKNLPSITWAHLGELSASCTVNALNEPNTVLTVAGLGSCLSSTDAMSHIPGNELNDVAVPTSCTSQSTSIADGHGSECQSSLCKDALVGTRACHVSSGVSPSVAETESPPTSEEATTSDTRYTIRTCLVNYEVVVCIPDLHKAVIDMYGQSVQVGNYMHRLSIPTHRFSRVLLKRLKAHNILSSKATLCTYITKADAARLLNMYRICNQGDDGNESPCRIEWDEPIILENYSNKVTEDSPKETCLKQVTQSSDQATLKIPLFVINYQIVVSMPDVHKAVQLLNGQSVQLHYNLEKLGIVKHRYSYTEVNQLKVLSNIKRPSLCTYITKSDVDKLLQFYATPENKAKLKLIEWQPPIAVERVVSGTAFDGSLSPDVDSGITDNNDDNAADGEIAESYSISDLYKVFVGDDLESIHNTNEVDDHPRTLQSTSPISSPSTPSLSISQPVQHTTITPDSSKMVDSPRAQLQASTSTAMPSSQCTPVHLHNLHVPDRAVNRTAVGVNQKQVDACSGRAIGLVPSQTCSSNNTVVTAQTDLPKPTFNSQIMATSNCSFRNFAASDFKMHASPITASSAITTATSVHSTSASTGRVRQIPAVCATYFTSFVPTEHGHQNPKRPSEASVSDATWLEQQAKKYRADNEEILKTLQRKETEMKILHDAYQEQIRQERDHRLTIQRELDEVKSSNTELLQNIERKELEMKILHDSYKLQMDLERKKREELEIEILNLRGSLGSTANVPQVKQEPL
ncbi:uncharacterized protein LOC144651989 [Oculina patagonica]